MVRSNPLAFLTLSPLTTAFHRTPSPGQRPCLNNMRCCRRLVFELLSEIRDKKYIDQPRTFWLCNTVRCGQMVKYYWLLHNRGGGGGGGSLILTKLVISAEIEVSRRVRAPGHTGQSFPLFSPSGPLSPPFFCPRVGDPREGRGDAAIPPTRGRPRRHGLGNLGWRREQCLGVKHWDKWPEH